MLKYTGFVRILALLSLFTVAFEGGSWGAPQTEPSPETETAQSRDKAPLFDIPWSINGCLQSRIRQPVENPDPISLRQRLRLEGKAGEGSVRVFASGWLEAELAALTRDTEEKTFLADFHEAHLTLDTRRLDIVVGMQQIRWGSADALGTMDIINPVDYRDPFVTARSTQRLPVGALMAKADLDFAYLDAFIVPWARFSPLAAHGSPWETNFLRTVRDLEDQGYAVVRNVGDTSLPEWGMRLTSFQHMFDLSFMYYNGYVHSPFYTWPASSNIFCVRSSYERFQAFGLSADMTIEDSAFRAELTYKKDYPFQTDEIQITRRDYYQFMLGWDRTFFTNLQVNLQGLYYYYTGDEVSSVNKKHTYGMTMGVEDKFWDDALRCGARGLWFASSNEATLELFSEYSYGDNWKFTVGYMAIAGPEIGAPSQGNIGQFSKNDFVYADIKYYF